MEQQYIDTEEYGYVYVLKNARMPGLIKIGMTERNDYMQRINELNRQTGVPVAFDVIYACKVRKEDAKPLEKALHKAFAPDRININREFFEMDEERVFAILDLFQLENITDEVTTETDAALTPYDRQARDTERMEAPRRRPTINFYTLGIKKDDNIFVTVSSERKVIYNGEECFLTKATKKILSTDASIAPSPYWKYNGRLLSEIYNDFYSNPIDGEE